MNVGKIRQVAIQYNSYIKVKGKVIPLQAVWPEGWVEVQLYSSMIAELEGVGGHQHAPAALYPREKPGTHFTGG